ncbi:recombinase family protein [Methanosphaera stadtmanae]|uniref:recombinase family protein n=1 Tax=Methanosphaera stadtmanae TaxID=2317 RepID=UPI002E79F3D2|nr:recombinase family protein [Methanosphaera stadtmanae]MEE0490259.1 recombinase family protein [Methanosphaera stadtmanae]
MNYENKVFGYIYTNREDGYMPYEDIDIIKRSFNISDRDIYLDRVNRSVFKVMVDYILCKGDTLVVKDIQTLGTNKRFILEQLGRLYNNGVTVHFIEDTQLNTNIDVNTKLELIKDTLVEIERTKKRQATIAGIRNMPINEYGIKYSIKTSNEIGRPVVQIPKNFGDIYTQWKNKELSSNEAIEQSGLKKSTFYSMVKAYEQLYINNK